MSTPTQYLERFSEKIDFKQYQNITITKMEAKTEELRNNVIFEKMNLKELICYCKEHGITRYSKKNKGELISHIKNETNRVEKYENTIKQKPMISADKNVAYTREYLTKKRYVLYMVIVWMLW